MILEENEMQHEEFQKMTEREQVPLLKLPE